MVEPCGVPSVVVEELRRLSPQSVSIVGGPSAVCDRVATTVADVTGTSPKRIAGSDRFGTAAALAGERWTSASTVFLASGTGFADALAGGPLAGIQGSPLLLAAPCTLPPSTEAALERLQPSRVVALGGKAALCDAVLARVSEVTGARVERIQGPDRFATAAAAAAFGWPGGSDLVYAAGGAGFADALGAGAAAATSGSPLLLVPSCGPLPGAVAGEINRLGPDTVRVAGGRSAVCDSMADQLAAA